MRRSGREKVTPAFRGGKHSIYAVTHPISEHGGSLAIWRMGRTAAISGGDLGEACPKLAILIRPVGLDPAISRFGDRTELSQSDGHAHIV
jgi:hypothetical protein